MRILTKSLDWSSISDVVRKELRNRECFSPSISVYRWWARRSHNLIGALVDRAIDVLGPGIIVSDPMSGGGTVAVEAARRGLEVHAQDINPWAALGLETLLKPVDPNELEVAVHRLLSKLEQPRVALYSHPELKGAEIACQLYVRRTSCPSCQEHNFLYPTTLLALDRRPASKPTTAWYGCHACGGVTHGGWKKPPARCKYCGQSLHGDRCIQRIRDFSVDCAHCGSEISLSPELLHESKFVPTLAQIHTNGNSTFVPGLAKGSRLQRTSQIGESLARPIPDGLETRALKRMGFYTWQDLYTERQLRAVEAALNEVPTATDDEDIAMRMTLSIAGFGEMAGYACRWDPRYRKVYELVSNHHYSRVHLAAEVNPLGSLGRGTIPKRLSQAVKAARWFSGSTRASVYIGSSEAQPIQNDSVDLVITDPPYFNSVQYGELSQVFIAFSDACGLPIAADSDLGSEAVPNTYLGRGALEYRQSLCRIMQETARTLKSEGRLLLTFHDKRIVAWEALAYSLHEAGMRVVGLAVVHSENETDHSKHGKNAMTSDLVIECVKNEFSHTARARICVRPQTDLEMNLAAAGYTIAGYLTGDDARSFRSGFDARLRVYGGARLIK